MQREKNVIQKLIFWGCEWVVLQIFYNLSHLFLLSYETFPTQFKEEFVTEMTGQSKKR